MVENKKEVRIIIAGCRWFDDFSVLETTVNDVISELKQKLSDVSRFTIVSGAARGADQTGELYARKYGLPVYRFPADWDAHGKAAGPIRNKQMADFSMSEGNIGVLVAFWDGESRGTKSMINLAKQNKLEVHIKRI